MKKVAHAATGNPALTPNYPDFYIHTTPDNESNWFIQLLLWLLPCSLEGVVMVVMGGGGWEWGELSGNDGLVETISLYGARLYPTACLQRMQKSKYNAPQPWCNHKANAISAIKACTWVNIRQYWKRSLIPSTTRCVYSNRSLQRILCNSPRPHTHIPSPPPSLSTPLTHFTHPCGVGCV
jgi:hypothetical protein